MDILRAIWKSSVTRKLVEYYGSNCSPGVHAPPLDPLHSRGCLRLYKVDPTTHGKLRCFNGCPGLENNGAEMHVRSSRGFAYGPFYSWR